jgi:O-antigen ligase
VLPTTPLNVPFLVFLAATFLTLLPAPSLAFGLKEWVKWLEILVVMWLVVDLAGELKGEENGDSCQATGVIVVLGILLLAGLSQAAVGIWQFGLRDTGPEHFAILGRFYRAYGTFEQPNPFGGFINLTALLALGVAAWPVGRGAWRVVRRNWSARQWLLWGFVGFCLVMTTAALVMSWSRGAWLGFAGGTAVFVVFWPRRRWQGIGLLILLFLLLWGGLTFNLLPTAVAQRITNFREDVAFGDARGVDINDTNYAVLERLAHWQAALDMARDHLWWGVGFGNYEPAYSDYALINWPYPLGHAHNYYLNLLAETGVVGLLAYGGLWTAVFGQAIRLLKQHDGLKRGIVLGLLAAFAALAVHHLVDKLYVNNIYIHLGVMLGLLQLLDRRVVR